MKNVKKYQYIECGLDNIYIEGLMQDDDNGEQTITVPCIQSLHKHIAKEIINKTTKISNKEIRFLRIEMGLTEGELAKKLRVSQDMIVKLEEKQGSSMEDKVDKRLRIAVYTMLVSERSPVISKPEKITLRVEKDGYSYSGRVPLDSAA